MPAADHLLDDPALVDRRHRLGGDALPVAEHGDRIRDLQDVVQEMRDEDDAAAAGAHPAQHLEQAPHFRGRERRGRLVQDDDAGAGIEHAGELDQLLQPDRQRAHGGSRIDVEAQHLELAPGARAHGLPVDHAVSGQLLAEIDILRDREVGDDGELLVHHADPGIERIAGRMELHVLAVDQHPPSIGRVHAGDDLHHGGLAGAVLADQAVDLAFAQLEIDVAQGRDAAEGLRDALHAQARDRCGFGRRGIGFGLRLHAHHHRPDMKAAGSARRRSRPLRVQVRSGSGLPSTACRPRCPW